MRKSWVAAAVLVVAGLVLADAKPGVVRTKAGVVYDGTVDEKTETVVVNVRGIDTSLNRDEVDSIPAVTDKKSGNPALAPLLDTFPMPGAAAGQYTPSFLGGSDLAVPAKAPNAGLGAQWVKYFTDTASQTALAKFAIPNTTSLLGVYQGQAQANKSTGEAAKNTWFVPNTPNWANVESGNILQNMLTSIATGKSDVMDAAKAADEQIAKTLNATG